MASGAWLAAGLLALLGLAWLRPRAVAAGLPCDVFAEHGTPCVAAHATTRALFADYAGPFYAVRRLSDNATLNVSVLRPGGVLVFDTINRSYKSYLLTIVLAQVSSAIDHQPRLPPQQRRRRRRSQQTCTCIVP